MSPYCPCEDAGAFGTRTPFARPTRGVRRMRSFGPWCWGELSLSNQSPGRLIAFRELFDRVARADEAGAAAASDSASGFARHSSVGDQT